MAVPILQTGSTTTEFNGCSPEFNFCAIQHCLAFISRIFDKRAMTVVSNFPKSIAYAKSRAGWLSLMNGSSIWNPIEKVDWSKTVAFAVFPNQAGSLPIKTREWQRDFEL